MEKEDEEEEKLRSFSVVTAFFLFQEKQNSSVNTTYKNMLHCKAYLLDK